LNRAYNKKLTPLNTISVLKYTGFYNNIITSKNIRYNIYN